MSVLSIRSLKLIYPVWAEDRKLVIMLLAALGLVGGVGSAGLLHAHNPYGFYLLPVGLVGVLGYSFLYTQELYHKYLACGWDMYF